MKLLFTSTVVALGIAGTVIFAAPSTTPAARIPVLLELFTSEGCSSCPPADQLLESLDRQPIANADLIVLSEHVDYWNYLGWSDPYSSAFFSDRQHKYSERLAATVYTPQMVIDGQLVALGSDRNDVMQAIAGSTQKPKLPLVIHVNSGTLHVEADTGGANADLYLVIAANHASSQVLRGENSGHTLTHVAVAESIVKIGKWGTAQTARDIPLSAVRVARAGEKRIIALLADPRTGRILGAAQTRI